MALSGMAAHGRRCNHDAPRAPSYVQYFRGLTLKDNDVVRTVMFIFFFLAEPIRLAAGWYGNLQENVSAAAPPAPLLLRVWGLTVARSSLRISGRGGGG